MSQAPAKPPSVKDVAAAAGVSLGTVSNVLNRPEVVTETTRLRVERAMRQLGFVRNESARQLRSGSSRTLTYVVLDARNPFFTDVAQGADEAAATADLALFLAHSANDPARERTILGLLQQQRVQGVLITPCDPDAEVLDAVARQGIPLVVVDRVRRDGAFCSVAVDDAFGGRLAAEHLLDLGHRRIALVGGPPSVGQVAERWSGARSVIDAAEDASVVVLDGAGMTVADGRRAGERLAGIPSARRPTAAFCANDLIALGLLQHATTVGWSIPGDLAIVGYDDIEFAGAAAVPLTSVRQPRAELGRRAAELVIAEANDPDHVHEQVVFTPELVARASTTGV